MNFGFVFSAGFLMKIFLGAFFLLSGLLGAGGANAAGDIRFAISGTNVVVTISGTVNPTALARGGLRTDPDGFTNGSAKFFSQVQCQEYGGGFASSTAKLTGPSNWTTPGGYGGYPFYWSASSQTGGGFGIDGSYNLLCLPVGYQAGQELVGTATITNLSLIHI